MQSMNPMFLAFVSLLVTTNSNAYLHWGGNDIPDAYGYDVDDLDQELARLQKRFLLGLGLTKNTPGKEIFFTSTPPKKQFGRA